MNVGRRSRQYTVATLLLVAILALLFVACGESDGEDPFVGTWGLPDHGTVAVIAKAGGDYRVTIEAGTLQNAERSGDRLRAWTVLLDPDGEPTGHLLEMVFTHDPASDRLVYTDPAAPDLRLELVRERRSTAIPSPWPSGSAQ